MASLFFEGFFLQASLIFALGAQNLFVLESGLQRRHHIAVSFSCFLCDLTLILLGVAGASALFAQFPILKALVGILGVAFLFLYGLSKILPALDEKGPRNTEFVKKGLFGSVLLSISFSILNPHAYLDAFILIGGFAAKYTTVEERLLFGFGAAIYSLVWFLILSTFAAVMRPFLESRTRMRTVMSVAGCFLIFLSIKLGGDVVTWVPRGFLPEANHQNFYSYPLPPGHVFTSILY